MSLRLTPLSILSGFWDLMSSAASIRLHAARGSVNVIHANSTRSGLMAVLASLWGGPPVIVHIHDALPDGRISWLVRRVLLARSSGLVAISSYTHKRFIGDVQATKQPFPILYNPIDVDRFDPSMVSRVQARRQLDLDPDVPLLGIVGQITPWKGHDTAIRALAEVRHVHPNVCLLVVGETKFVDRSTRFDNAGFKHELRELSEELNLEHAVTFLGERADVPLIMRALDVLLMPSWAEPLGRSMLEGMCVATPVVATRIGGPSEVIRHGETGVLADPHSPHEWAEAILSLLADPAAAAEMASAAREVVVRCFDRQAYAESIVLMYQEITHTD
jgi:glycosyltransferase involved in cell wall biosynthesis